MTLTFVLRLLRGASDTGTGTVAGRVESVRNGKQYTVHSLAELEDVLLNELAAGHPTVTPTQRGNPT